MNRKQFINKSGIASLTFFVPPYAHQEQSTFNEEEIYEFVAAAHKDFDQTKAIIESKPLLLNCTNQFQKGDFETAIGGASHMGRKDIADLLVAKGARLDIFNLTFLGYDQMVRQLIADFPQLLNAPGPHGFTLLHHAEVGGHGDMVDWLKMQGLNTTHFKGIFG